MGVLVNGKWRIYFIFIAIIRKINKVIDLLPRVSLASYSYLFYQRRFFDSDTIRLLILSAVFTNL